ncbi:MAG: damage-inducible protein DinB [Gammaproteobacteria bacterium]|nr:damage-inducible protein DinB [Gammaproteobacteria bacterium]
MSTLNQFILFSEYNKLMNQRIIESANRLTMEQLKGDRGAFFKSVLGTLNHILVGDIIWLKRFALHPANQEALEYITNLDHPASLDAILFDDLDNLRSVREKIDEVLICWITGLSESDIEASLSYKNMAGIQQNKLVESLISHLFLHQVHHRGQVTTMIFQSGVDFGDTDLLEIIDDHSA